MRGSVICAALALAASLVVPAAADAPPGHGRPGVGLRPPVARHLAPPPRVWHPSRPRHHAGYRHHRQRVYGVAGPVHGPSFGPEPHYYPGYGNASPNAGFGALAPVPVAVTLYREAYIGRGLIYNTPPQPHWPSSAVISVRY